jgi:hypothetical protein
MDVIVGLQGRHTANWDEAMRPIPATHPPAPLPVYFNTDFSKH